MSYTPLVQSGHKYFSLEGYYKKTFENMQTKYIRHSTMEIMYVTSGSCEVSILLEEDPTSPINIHIGKNQFIFIDANTIHKLITKKKCVICHVEFKAVDSPVNLFTFEDLFHQCSNLKTIFHSGFHFMHLYDNHGVLDSIMAIHKEANYNNKWLSTEQSSVYLVKMQLLLANLLLSISRCFEQNSNRYSGSSYVDMIVKYLHENYQDGELTINSLANALNINSAYMQKTFRSVKDCSIMKYLRDIRIREAVYLLLETNKSITDIAFDVGFNSRQNFYVAFRKVMNMGPEQYRIIKKRENIEEFNKIYETEIIY